MSNITKDGMEFIRTRTNKIFSGTIIKIYDDENNLIMEDIFYGRAIVVTKEMEGKIPHHVVFYHKGKKLMSTNLTPLVKLNTGDTINIKLFKNLYFVNEEQENET